MKTNLIGISGKIGSGKGNVGKILQAFSTKVNMNGVVGQLGHDMLSNPELCKDVINGNLWYGSNNYQIKKFKDKRKDIVSLLIGCNKEQLEDHEFINKELGEEWRVWSVWISFDQGLKVFTTKKEAETFNDEVWGDEHHHIRSYLLSPIEILNILSTESGRQLIHPNIWINALFADYKTLGFGDKDAAVLEFPNWIITDVRFPNEAKAIKDRGGIVIRVNRDYVSYKNVENEYSVLDKLKTLYLHSEVCAWEYLENVSFDSNIPTSIIQKGIDLFLKWDGSEQYFTYVPGHPSETALDDYEFDHVIDNNGSIKELVEKVKSLKLV